MQSHIPQSQLVACLQITNKLIRGNPQLPILSNVSFVFQKNHLEIKATDLTTSLCLRLEIDEGVETSFLISGTHLLEYLQTLAPQALNLELKESTLFVTQGSSKAQFPTTPTKDYPNFSLIQPAETMEMATDELKKILKQVAIAVAAEEARPILTGVLVKPSADGKSLQWVGTDGYRLSLVTQKIKSTWSRELLIPLKPLTTMVREIKGEMVTLGFDGVNHQLWLKASEQEVAIRLLAGDYPQFDKILPKSFGTSFGTTKSELLQAVKQMAVFARQNANIMKAEVGAQLVLSTKKGITGGGEITLDVTLEGDPLIVAFNFRYLQEYLNVIDEGNLTISLNGPKAPVQCISEKHPDLTHIIMPVDLRE